MPKKFRRPKQHGGGFDSQRLAEALRQERVLQTGRTPDDAEACEQFPYEIGRPIGETALQGFRDRVTPLREYLQVLAERVDGSMAEQLPLRAVLLRSRLLSSMLRNEYRTNPEAAANQLPGSTAVQAESQPITISTNDGRGILVRLRLSYPEIDDDVALVEPLIKPGHAINLRSRIPQLNIPLAQLALPAPSNQLQRAAHIGLRTAFPPGEDIPLEPLSLISLHSDPGIHTY